MQPNMGYFLKMASCKKCYFLSLVISAVRYVLPQFFATRLSSGVGMCMCVLQGVRVNSVAPGSSIYSPTASKNYARHRQTSHPHSSPDHMCIRKFSNRNNQSFTQMAILK